MTPVLDQGLRAQHQINYLMSIMQYTKDGVPTKPITLLFPDSVVLEGDRPRTKGRGVSYGKIGLTTVAVTQDPPSMMPLVL